MYDAWQNQLEAIASAMRLHRINIAFVSSLQASQYLDSLGIKDFRSYWVPEAVTVSNYKWNPYSERKIDILQMGRRWDEYHFEIEELCRKNHWTYLYEERPGENIFPTRQSFIDGLASAKISICVPSAITHPARSGTISTVTWRYFESMASKVLILGKIPDEMKQLFDYEPVVEIDMSNPKEQLREVLTQYADYIPLIERNYAFVQQNHQWQNRIELMQKYFVDFEQTTALSLPPQRVIFLRERVAKTYTSSLASVSSLPIALGSGAPDDLGFTQSQKHLAEWYHRPRD